MASPTAPLASVKGRDHVSQYLRVHDRLPEADKDRLLAGELTFTAAREMVAIPGTRGDRRKETFGQEEAGLPLPPPLADLRTHNDEARRIIRRILDGGLDGDIGDLALTMDCPAHPSSIRAAYEPYDFLTPALWAHLQWFDENSDLPDEAEPVSTQSLLDLAQSASTGEIELRGAAPFDRASVAQAMSVVGKENPAGGAPVSVRLGQALSAEFPKLQNYDIRPGDRLQEDLGLSPDSFTVDGIAAVIVREFGVTLPVLDIRQARSVGEIARMIIRRMGAAQPLLPNSATHWPTPSRPSAQPTMPDRHPAVGGMVGQHWRVQAIQLTIGGAPLAIELRNIVSGDTMRFVPVLRTNRKVIDELGQERPDLWQALKTHTQAHRASLTELDHLTPPPPTGVACNHATRR